MVTTKASVKNFHQQSIRFASLIGILLVGLFAFFAYKGRASEQFFIATIISFAYFLWGIVYHTLEGDLHPRIVIEYLLMSLFSLLLVRGALFTRL